MRPAAADAVDQEEGEMTFTQFCIGFAIALAALISRRATKRVRQAEAAQRIWLDRCIDLERDNARLRELVAKMQRHRDDEIDRLMAELTAEGILK